MHSVATGIEGYLDELHPLFQRQGNRTNRLQASKLRLSEWVDSSFGLLAMAQKAEVGEKGLPIS